MTLPARPPQRSSPRPVAARARALLLALACAACGATPEAFVAEWNMRGGAFTPEDRAAFSSARARLLTGDSEGARSELAAIVARDPNNIEAGAWLQEVELSIITAAQRGETPGDEALARLARDPDPLGALRRRYARAADEAPSVARWVLAARLAAEPDVALQALDQALALDPGSAWAHYARAHALIEQRRLADRWSLAREALDAALDAEPGFLRARRLRAWMLAEEGQRQAALGALEAWLVAAEDDPRVPDERRVEARLDRALLLLLDGRAERAARELAELEGEPLGRSRRLALLAVAEQERGDLERSLAAVRRAEAAEPGSVLPLVQRALLLERFRDDPDGAEELWRAIAERTEDAHDLADLVQTLRARVHLERRDAARDGNEP